MKKSTGYCLMIGGTILLIIMFLLAAAGYRWKVITPEQSKGASGEVSEWYDDVLYTIKVTTTCASITTIDESCVYKYYHFLGYSKDDQVLVDVTGEFPTESYLDSNVDRFLLSLEEGV